MAHFALDFDGTYTADPEMWNQWIDLARSRGHVVNVVTMRYEGGEGDEVKALLAGRVDSIHFTARGNKSHYCLSHGVQVDIWIEDNPFFIFHDAVS